MGESTLKSFFPLLSRARCVKLFVSVPPSARSRSVRVFVCVRRPPNHTIPFHFSRSHCAVSLVFDMHAVLLVGRLFVVAVQLQLDVKVEAEESRGRGLGFRARRS